VRAVRWCSLGRPYRLRGEVVLDGTRADSIGIKFAPWRLWCRLNVLGTASRERDQSQRPKRDLFQVVMLLHWIMLRSRFHEPEYARLPRLLKLTLGPLSFGPIGILFRARI
jgi:hypothetical protein